MFEPTDSPRLYALPAGADFPKALIDGLQDRLGDAAPEQWARCTLIVNTRRMARRLRELFDAGPSRLLPRIKLITDLDDGRIALPAAISPLRRRLELSQLIAHLLDAEPDLAPRTALFDLADSLSDLMAEMAGEGVSAARIAELDVSDLSGHWARAQKFIQISTQFAAPDVALDAEARQRRLAEALCDLWRANPPTDPIILAGSTGSRGTTQLLMQAIASLPQGAVVLPGFDFDLPAPVWTEMTPDKTLAAEDHPQYRFKALADQMELSPSDILPWTQTQPPAADRNAVISLALRPAPVTHAWRVEGPSLPPLGPAMAGVTLIEAPSPRVESLAIAMRLRQAVEDGQSAALITPDRMLTRQVSAALDRWNITPDDSAGQPLHLAPPGRFLRQIAELHTEALEPDTLLALLKHPLCHSGDGRRDHLLHTRDFELWLRKAGAPHPSADTIDAFAASTRNPPPPAWQDWVKSTFCEAEQPGEVALTHHVTALRARVEQAAAGSLAQGSGQLWEQNAGHEALRVLNTLDAQSDAGGDMSARDVAVLLDKLLQNETVRDRDKPHPLVMIWGTLEARVQGADVLILGGLNEGSWPEAAKPDPWLNRHMRHRAGLLLPERRIGLAAHDFQQAVAAETVVMTRSKRSDDAETVPSRWLNRLTNLLGGLPDQGGPHALAEMRAKGQVWLDWAEELERAERKPPAPRPSPRPPLEARPAKLSVTQIKTLVRDPYAIYARHVLRLSPLPPLKPEPDALLRGIVVHRVLEAFTHNSVQDKSLLNAEGLLATADHILAQSVPWAAERRMWRARLERVADWFIKGEIARRESGVQVAWEVQGKSELPDVPFTLTGIADRVDRTQNGWAIFDYKTGSPPGSKEQMAFDRQLLLEVAMLTDGAFDNLPAGPVPEALFIGLGSGGKEIPAPLDEISVSQIWEDFRALLFAYQQPEQGYTARRMVQKEKATGDYDQLSRFGEWDGTTEPTSEDVG